MVGSPSYKLIRDILLQQNNYLFHVNLMNVINQAEPNLTINKFKTKRWYFNYIVSFIWAYSRSQTFFDYEIAADYSIVISFYTAIKINCKQNTSVLWKVVWIEWRWVEETTWFLALCEYTFMRAINQQQQQQQQRKQSGLLITH